MESQVGDEESTEIIAFGGPMYDEGTARKTLEEVLLVDAEHADTEDGEHVFGFDPDDAALDNIYFVNNGNFGGVRITPITFHFSLHFTSLFTSLHFSLHFTSLHFTSLQLFYFI